MYSLDSNSESHKRHLPQSPGLRSQCVALLKLRVVHISRARNAQSTQHCVTMAKLASIRLHVSYASTGLQKREATFWDAQPIL